MSLYQPNLAFVYIFFIIFLPQINAIYSIQVWGRDTDSIKESCRTCLVTIEFM